MHGRPPLGVGDPAAADAPRPQPPEPQSWEEEPLPLTAAWLTAALRAGGALAPGAAVVSLRFDPAHIRRGEGDRLRRVLLCGDGAGVPASVYVKQVEDQEAAFYALVAPILRGIRTPRVHYLGASLLVLEDVAAPCWDAVEPSSCQDLGALSQRDAALVSAYARLHSATWGTEPTRHDNAGASGLRKGLQARGEWRRAASQPWIRQAVLAATEEGRLGRLAGALCLAVAGQWQACEAAMGGAACILHGDPHGGNILDVGSGGADVQPPCILDFESVAFDHPAWDLSLLTYRLWASQWAGSPVRTCKALAQAYTGELARCGVETYGVDACAADLGVAIPLCFAGSLLSSVAVAFEEWWHAEHEPAASPGIERQPAAAEVRHLEQALVGLESESALVGLPDSVAGRYRAELEQEGDSRQAAQHWAGIFSEIEF